MEEVLHIEDYDWWCEDMQAAMSLRHWYIKRKANGYKDMDYDFFIARKEAHIKEVENKLNQIDFLIAAKKEDEEIKMEAIKKLHQL